MQTTQQKTGEEQMNKEKRKQNIMMKEGLNYREMRTQNEFLIVMNNEQITWLNEAVAKEMNKREEQLLMMVERNNGKQ